jgi:predicted RecB family endonuclease
VQLRNAIGSWGTYVVKVDNATEAREQEDLDAAELTLSAALNATQDSDNDTAVQEARKAVNVLKNARKNRQFPLVIAAYMAAATVSGIC